jgi:hypothetical protein
MRYALELRQQPSNLRSSWTLGDCLFLHACDILHGLSGLQGVATGPAIATVRPRARASSISW